MNFSDLPLSEDPRWRRFNDRDFRCPCCGENFGGVFDVAFDHPEPWRHGNRKASGQDVLRVGEDWISSDLCVQCEDRFVRCIMPFPIIGSDETFAFGVWGSMSEQSFEHYRAGFDRNDYGDFEGCFSWLSNILPEVGQEDWVQCNLVIEDPTKRPVLYAKPNAEKLHGFQSDGITFDRLLDIYAAVGQDIRPHLADA